MSFGAIQEEINTSADKITIDQLVKFHDLCVEKFTGALDLSKGNPQDFMPIMSILTSVAEKLTSKLKNSGDEKVWYVFAKVSTELLMFKEANTFSDIVLNFNDKNKQAWFYKGRYYEKEKNYDEAEKCFNKAIKIDETYYIAWFTIASMYEKIDLEKKIKSWISKEK